MIKSGVGFQCCHWLQSSSVLNGINTPPVILVTGGGCEGYLRAKVEPLVVAVTTSTSLCKLMAKRHTSRSPPQEFGLSIFSCLCSHCIFDMLVSRRTDGYFNIVSTTNFLRCELIFSLSGNFWK